MIYNSREWFILNMVLALVLNDSPWQVKLIDSQEFEAC